jgi:hypothetical protein
MGTREDRIAENETVFRRANEQLRRDWADLQRNPRDEVLFVCECGDLKCQEVIRLTLAEYEDVRADANTFAISNGHEDPETEEVLIGSLLDRNDRFAIVRKRPPQRRITEAEDPRHHG